MDISEMSVAELHELTSQIQDRLMAIQSAAEQAEIDIHQQISDAIDTLIALRGPDSPAQPTMENLILGNVSITEVRTFTHEELQEHSGLALALVLGGLQILTETVEALARVQSGTLT